MTEERTLKYVKRLRPYSLNLSSGNTDPYVREILKRRCDTETLLKLDELIYCCFIISLKELIMAHDVYKDDHLLSDMVSLLASYSVFVESWNDILVFVRNVLKCQGKNPTFSPEDKIILTAVLSFLVIRNVQRRPTL